MAEEKKTLMRGVVVEFDFTAVDGAQLLFETAQKILDLTTRYCGGSGTVITPRIK